MTHMLVGTALGGPEVQRLHTGEIIRPYLFPNLKNERKNGNEKSLKLVAEKSYVDNDMQSKRKKRKYDLLGIQLSTKKTKL